MKISKDLPHFENKKVLFVLTGKQIMRFLIAENDQIEEKELHRVSGFFYPDREGYSEHRDSKNQISMWGPFDAGHDTWKEREFLLEFKEHLINILRHEKPDEIYLFVEKEEQNKVRKGFPRPDLKKIKMVIPENFVRNHPFDILMRIKSEELKGVGEPLPLRPEPRQILINSDKAANLIRIRRK